MKPKPRMADAAARVYKLRLELQYVEPLIWREIEVLSSTSLEKLHHALQILMDWEESHLWAFQAGERRFEPPHENVFGFADEAEDAGRVTLGAILSDTGSRLLYNYDFGDDWLIVLTVIAIDAPKTGVRYPRCVAGERAGPLEDSGGPPGYEQLLAARKKPRSRDAKELLEWAGDDWDPGHFDIDAANKRLAKLSTPRRVK